MFSSTRRGDRLVGMSVLVLLVTAGIVSDVPNAVRGQKSPPVSERRPPANGAAARLARGKYLVHEVAHCDQCHTPRDANGNLIQSRLLTGAPIPVDGPEYAQPWAAASASIAGLGSYEQSYVFYLLTHGHKPDGTAPQAPMPQFRLTDRDARAVIAYLNSL